MDVSNTEMINLEVSHPSLFKVHNPQDSLATQWVLSLASIDVIIHNDYLIFIMEHNMKQILNV